MEGLQILKKRLRFSDHDDLSLLREVLGQNPFQNSLAWETIKENLYSLTSKNFTTRTLKDHLERLIKLWVEKIKLLKDKSGIEVTETEKDVLCRDIYNLMRENKKERKVDVKKLGTDARDKWAQQQSDEPSLSAMSRIAHDHVYLSTLPPCEEVIEFGVEENCQNLCNKIEIEQGEISREKPTASTPFRAPVISVNTPTSKPSKILAPIRSRKRKINAQRQGLAYLEQYDRQQAEKKQQEFELEQGKLKLEERKLDLEERKIALLEKQFQLRELKYKKTFSFKKSG